MQSTLTPSLFSCLRTILLISTIVAIALPTHAQKPYGNYKVQQTRFGQPDIQGFWTNVTMTPVTRPRDVEGLVYSEAEVARLENRAEISEREGLRPTDPNAPAEFRHNETVERSEARRSAGGSVGGYNRFWLNPGNTVMRVSGEARTSILTTSDGQVPTLKDGSRPNRRGSRAQGPAGYVGYEIRGMNDRCIISFGRNAGPPMFANGFYNNNYQIVQSPDSIMILVEMVHDARIIRLNSEHRTDGVRPWFGDSIGWWEGNTLVVETTNIPARQHFYGSWENLTVTERFTRVADERLHYAFTIEDPTMWEKPWGGEYEFSQLDGQIYEYACHEGNYALPGILKGMLNDAAE